MFPAPLDDVTASRVIKSYFGGNNLIVAARKNVQTTHN